MRSSIIIRNAKNSVRDYIIYLITVVISLSLVYAFNMIVFSDEIMALSAGMGAMAMVVVGLSVIVVVVIGWLIHYMARFMLEKRSREFGTYMLLGVPTRTITSVFIRENLVMGAAAFVGAVFVGTLLYQIIYLIILRLFHATYGISAIFSIKAVMATLLYAILMYGVSMLKLRHYLGKMEIHDFMEMDKRNEKAANRSRKYSFARFIIYAVVEIASCILYWTVCSRNVPETMAGILITLALTGILVCIYGMYTTLTAFITKAALSSDHFKYGKDHLFILRGLTAKLGTIGKTLGTLALLMTLTLAATQLGVLFERFFDEQSKTSTGFEVAVSGEDASDFDSIIRYIDEKYGISFQYQYPLYMSTEDPLYDHLGLNGFVEGTPVLAASDFYKLWDALGYPKLTLNPGEYLLIGGNKVYDIAQSGAPDIIIDGQQLRLQECRNESFNTGNGYHGTGYVIVVADPLAKSLPVFHTCLAMETKVPTVASDFMDAYDDNTGSGLSVGPSIDAMVIRAEVEANKSSAVVSIAFSLFFVGLIFACTAATILAIQQLSDALRHQHRYHILSMLGMKNDHMGRMIFKQTLIYFLIPISLPFPLSIVLSAGMNRLALTSMLSLMTFFRAIGLSLGLFLIVYFLYFMATYLGYKRKIMEKQ